MNLRTLRRGAAIGAACAALFVLLSAAFPMLFGAEWWVSDTYARLLAKSRKPDPRIVLVTISDASIQALNELYGRPPYSREVWARVVDELKRDGASVILFDVLFAEENPNDPAGDRAFAQSLVGAPVVLPVQTERASEAAAIPRDFKTRLWIVRGLPASDPAKATTPHPMFRAAEGLGTMRLVTSSESARVHRYPMGDHLYGGFVPGLAIEGARQFLHRRRIATVKDDVFEFAGRRAQVNHNLEMLIRWSGAKASDAALSYPNVDLHQVIQASLMREEGSTETAKLDQFAAKFRGKAVIVGVTAAGLMDFRATPLSATHAGIEIHANALDNVLNNDFNAIASPWLMFPLILLTGAGVGVGVDRTRTQWAAALIAIGALVVIAAAGYAALLAGYVVPVVAAALSVALTFIVLTVINFIAEQHQTAVLKHTFGRYVSPQILDHILAHPERVELGGERRDLTILFSDIRGFTSISEASEPEEVVDMLNEYLTRMVEILLAHGGTLDKFIGDAVMGFWNAPAFDPNHPRNAVLCAIEMVQETARLRERWVQEGKAELRIGVGVNTGEAVVGNIGSARVFGYTVIGDAVNLASRLEGKNKDYVTEIIISEFTKERIGEEIPTVYLDEVKVKGKEKAVKIYQVKVDA